MKLRNKKTGEIIELLAKPSFVKRNDDYLQSEVNTFNSLTELNEEWEDAPEEPKEYWYLSGRGEVRCIEDDDVKFDKDHKEIGNYFETEEEAEKAVEKLKAWKRLKDKGFRFSGWTIDDGIRISICTNTDEDDIYDEDKRRIKPDLDLLFGGEE